MGRNFVLTTHQVARAVELYQDGYSRRQIAEYFDVSDTAVGNALRAAKQPFRPRAEAATLGLQHWKKSRRRASSVWHFAQQIAA